MGARDGVKRLIYDRQALLVQAVYKSKMSTRVGQTLSREHHTHADEDRGEYSFLHRSMIVSNRIYMLYRYTGNGDRVVSRVTGTQVTWRAILRNIAN